MSIKKLFDSTDTTRNYLSETDDKNAFESVESGRNVRAIKDKQDSFIPQVDYSDPINFAKYGSAYLYYKSAMSQIYDYYPYDGSDAEINEYYNRLLDIEKYVFNNLYPRTNGLIHLSAGGWGSRTGAQVDGYGLPATQEYISFFGGPHTASYTKLSDAFPEDGTNKYQYSNVYDTDIYTTAGLPSDYASGSRASNLACDFGRGVTVEFWLKKDGFNIVSTTKKEVIFDIWNGNATSSADYGRLTVELMGSSSVSPFRLTAMSGTSGVSFQTIGTSITTGSLSGYHHYAISFYNSGSTFNTKLYVDGVLEDHNSVAGALNTLNAKNMKGRIGALVTSPSGSAAAAGAGKLSGSLDEFRFWKVRRNSNQIGRYWKTQVAGGSNTDISNADLGIYYKFNEGITTDTVTDSIVLDYSGRISNGSWTGYTVNSRATTSAMVLSNTATSEYKDPIIYSTHPSVSSLETDLLSKGTYHDANNNGMFVNLMPSWILENAEEETADLRLVSHIVATYFDKLALQINALSKFKRPQYTSASATPLPFAQHMPQSMGLYTPEIFVDATVLEKFLNRTQDQFFQGDIEETKNLIYLNLYNSLSGIYKAKGTEKAIKNVFRCFNLDDQIIKFKTYADATTYELQNNLSLVLEQNSSVNFSNNSNLAGVVFQKADAGNSESYGYISGTYTDNKEDRYGFTVEANVIFPDFERRDATVDRGFTEVSLFGMALANTASAADMTWASPDPVNLQVYAVRDNRWSKNVYFKLTSSVTPFPFPILTSSTYFDVYDNEEWNFAIRLKPSNYPRADVVTGSSVFTYDLEFSGINTLNDTVQNNFLLTASISQAVGSNFLQSAKRMYAGARRTNMTGALLARSDVLFTNMKYWTKYLEYDNLTQHTFDINNAGISGSFKNISALDPNLSQIDAQNANTLALHWTFANVTGSDSSGNFYYVQDMSSGSALLRDNYGWPGAIAGYQHTGYGYGFKASSTDVIKKDLTNITKFTDPESPVASNMINVLGDSEKVYGVTQMRPKFFHTIEKSMYGAMSEDMLSFFAGVIDFNDVIGAPVNRYRMRYKMLEKLREAFFRKVTTVSNVEKFIDYYKWLDDAIATIVSQLMPASEPLVDNSYNVIESHVLERNKYRTQFPTIEFVAPDPETPMMGINEQLYNWRITHAPVSNNEEENTNWWKERADRVFDAAITSGDATINRQREGVRETADVVNNQTSSTVSTVNSVQYQTSVDVLRTRALPYRFTMNNPTIIKGGVNFNENKDISKTYNALMPAGPINQDGDVFVPQNVLLAYTKDINPYPVRSDIDPSKKIKRYFGVQHGREWQDGVGYYNVKSSLIFPFNVISSSVTTGYNKQVVEKVTGNVEITNLHNDVYGRDMEKPMQGPFTDYAVGGHQSRHIALNRGSDTYLTRPEAWKLVLGTCTSVDGVSGAIGMVGADYPWPEANAVNATPYPMTGAQKAVYYRGFTAKSPVNIRNIHMTTGSAVRPETVLGNYRENYDVVNSVGGYQNPRGFVESPPQIPSNITTGSLSPTQARSILDIRRNDESHFQFVAPYSIAYYNASSNKSIIRQRFSSPGGIETIGQGYGDIRADEYSVYNALNYRNLTVLRPFQNMSGTVSENTGVGTPGIRVHDINGKDYGLRWNLTQHAGRFGRNSVLVTNPGATYDQAPSFIKINRNPRHRKTITGTEAIISGSTLTNTNNVNFSGVDGSCLLLTGAGGWSAGKEMFYAVTSSGASFTGWFRPGTGTGGQQVFQIGRTQGNSFPAFGIRKTYTSSKHRIILEMATQDAASGGSERKAQWYITGAAPEQWHHIAITWSGSNGALASKQPTMYLNGVSQSLTVLNAPYAYYQNNMRTRFNFKGFSGTPNVGITGDEFIAFGSTHQNTSYQLSASLDEVTVWKRPLTTAEVTEIYNNGVPCDVTASAAYTGNTTSLFDWIRFGDGAQGAAINIANPAVLHVTNAVNGMVVNGTTAYLPLCVSGNNNTSTVNSTTVTPPAGCSPSVVGFRNIISTTKQYDNFWVQHQIPRADRQYAWITGALAPEALGANLRYYGYAPTSGPQESRYELSKSTGITYVSYFDFVTASSVLGRAGTSSLYQPALDLSIFVDEPVDDNEDNTIGFGLAASNLLYYNAALLSGTVGGLQDNLYIKADFFNLTMTQRKSTFGYRAAPQMGPIRNAVLRKHHKDNVMTLYTSNTLKRYTVKPYTTRGRMTIMNLDVYPESFATAPDVVENVTLKTSYGNERLYFSDSDLTELLFPAEGSAKELLFDQMVGLVNSSPNYKLNWVLYSEELYPTAKNEYTTACSSRVGYDNLFWRSTDLQRYELFKNSIGTNSYGVMTKQSSWPLDAPLGFLTRSYAAIPQMRGGSPAATLMRQSNSAGEMQNEYLHALPGAPATSDASRSRNCTIGALYARKHILGGPLSVVSPSGMAIPETGSAIAKGSVNESFNSQPLYGGEAYWDAPLNAGIVEAANIPISFVGEQTTTYTFKSAPSEPWFKDYDSYQDELKYVSKGYAVVPEFRISAHVADYENNPGAWLTRNMLEIVGTTTGSTNNSNFYKDYSNTEFMKNFSTIRDTAALDPHEIMLVCSASIRFMPYKGFYPAQRTVDLVKQFKESYGQSIIGQAGGITNAGGTDGLIRPLAQAMFAPGLLYNTIKSGLAVDYPIATVSPRIRKANYGFTSGAPAKAQWMITPAVTGATDQFTYQGGEYWDYRMPFKALINPEEYIAGLQFFDVEPHPSASINATSSFVPVSTDSIYTKMSSNFFGEIANFFLEDSKYTQLTSRMVTSDLRFQSGSVYGARIKLRRSMNGARIYNAESGSTGNNVPFDMYGGKFYDAANNRFRDGNSYPLPQDPRQQASSDFQESFTLYSRPTAFGPPVAARPDGAAAMETVVLNTRPWDSLNGFNGAYTPPYYNGEAWLDIIFEPNPTETYDLEKILSEVKTCYWRCDPGPSASANPFGTATKWKGTQFIPTISGNYSASSDIFGDTIYGGKNINSNIMQLSASINPFGVERILKTQVDAFGNVISSTDETVGMKWVIQPKMETPMPNFNDSGTRPITNATGTLSIPTYASQSVPRGIWHQFGIIEPSAEKGLFLEIGEIPKDWLKGHYDVRDNNTIYNKNNAAGYGSNMYRIIEPLTDKIKFDVEQTSKKLGKFASGRTLKEAIVAVPYQVTSVPGATDSTISYESKNFFGIDAARVEASLSPAVGTADGDSLEYAGMSIRRLVSTMQQYVLPPAFDFLNNSKVKPMVMYFFEFEYELDQDDLNYIWQNLAPRDYKKITQTVASTAHNLADNELMTADDVMNSQTRWMVFKVKQKSQAQYENFITPQAGETTDTSFSAMSTTQAELADLSTDTYSVNYNWPYDYVSFVETIKFDAQVLYKNRETAGTFGDLSED